MIYRIAFEADKHWGAMRPEEQYRSSYILKKFLAEFPIDLYINLGDFFDTKLLLNSKASIYAVRDFTEKVQICASRGIPVRAIKGTRSHDYDQWDIFDNLAHNPLYNFKYFKRCTVEETLPGLNIWYAPEENMSFSDYMSLYRDVLLDEECINLGAFHGSFDAVMPSIALELANSTGTTLVFNYNDCANIVKGPMVAGHWHNGETFGDLAYVGSYDRWTFGEDNIKGFAIYEYNTDTHEYRWIKVPNILAANYKTFDLYTSNYPDSETYKALMDLIDEELNRDPDIQIRISIKINEERPDTDAQLDNLKFHFANERRVHFTLVNQIKKDQKKKKREANQRLESAYSYVRDNSIDIAEKIARYIKQVLGHTYSNDEIATLIKNYVKSDIISAK